MYPRLYQVWKGMRGRCNNPNNTSYLRYGGRGIKVCDEWNDFSAFAVWSYENGYDENAEYQQCTIDRIDNDGDYCPENCRWSNATDQNLNQHDTELISYDGKQMTICQWADFLGVKRSMLIHRKKHGWDIERMLTEPSGDYEWGAHCRKQVVCVETQQVYDSIALAAENHGVSAPNITAVLSKTNRTSGGYHWILYNGEDVASLCSDFLTRVKKDTEQKAAQRLAASDAARQRKKELRRIREHKCRTSESYDWHRRKVLCVETGEVFNSVKEAAEFVHVNSTNISACCAGRQNTIRGYHWKYAD